MKEMQVEYKNDVLVKNMKGAAPNADVDGYRPRTSTKSTKQGPVNTSSSPYRKPATATEVRKPKKYSDVDNMYGTDTKRRLTSNLPNMN